VRIVSPQFFRPRLAAASDGASARAGHADLFRTTVLPHLDGAYNLACYLTRDPTLSEDIVQDAFLRAYRAFGDFRGGSAKAWLFAIVRNCCRTAMTARGASALQAVPEAALELEQHADESPDPEQALIRSQGAAEARSLLDGLPEPFREALVLRELEELSYREIAQVTGVAIGTVMSRLSRARAILTELATNLDSANDQARSSL
jgi:RNA polymerase sigma-70 factor (ECF subfamily)